MTEPSPIDDLKALRELLVAQRRYVIRDLFHLREVNKEQGAPSAGGRGDDVKRLQEQIEAVDRAIKDEEEAAGPDARSMVG